MRILNNVILIVLFFLAGSSGITKFILMEQDVVFFGKYGFTDPILIAYGSSQLIGAILLIIPKTRFIGAILVAITFAVSAVVLIMDGKTVPIVFTFIALALLGFIAKHSLNDQRKASTK